MFKSRPKGFSLVEVLLAGSLAFLTLGICYVLYAEGFQKSVRLTQMSQRLSDMFGLRDLLLMDAKATSETGVFIGCLLYTSRCV